MSAALVRRLSGSGRGAIAVVAVTGAGALARVAALAGGANLSLGELRLVALHDGSELLDHALVAVLGEREVELHLHGGPGLVARVLAALGGESPADAPPDLERAALLRLPQAPSEAGARLLLDQAEGALRRELEELLGAPESEAAARLDAMLERARVARFALRPARVLLRGPVNAGKSTLFNALFASERVLVSEEPGTTRDLVRERVLLEGWPLDLWDTPGERGSGAEPSRALDLERAGLALALELERAADWIVWLAPPGARAPVAEPFGGRLAVFASRADECAAPPAWGLSALRDPADAVRVVAARFREHFALPAPAWSAGAAVPFDEGQAVLLRRARASAPAARAGLISRLLERHVDPGPHGG